MSDYIFHDHPEDHPQQLQKSSDTAYGLRDNLLVRCRDAIDSLHLQIQKQRNSRKFAQSRLIQVTSHSEHLSKVNQQLQISLDALTDQLATLKVQKATLIRKIKEKDLDINIQSPRSQYQDSHRFLALQQQNNLLNLKLKDMKEYCDDLWNQLASLNQTHSNLKMRQEDLQRKLESVYNQTSERILEGTRETMSRLETQLQKKNTDLQYFLGENDDLRRENQYLQEMLNRKQQQLDKVQKQSLDRLQQAMKEQNTQNFDLKIENLEKQLKQEKLNSRVLKDTITALETQSSSSYKQQLTMQMQKRIKEKQEYINQLKETKQGFDIRIGGLEQKIQSLEEEKGKLLVENDVLERDLKVARQSLKAYYEDTITKSKKKRRKRTSN